MQWRGFTLIELAVVLAILAILAAILTPIVTGYLDQARLSRAQGDMKTITDAIRLYQRDTGLWPIYASATDRTSNTCCGGGSTKFIGGANGTNPGDGLATWSVGSYLASSSLETYLNGNFVGMAANAFPKAGFRGPYVGALEADPWGNKYILTALNLTGATNHSYIISAGPNGLLDTTLNQGLAGEITVGSDDIVYVIK